MKSIVEEASSIAKAIENGWTRAGKPEEFSVRIFEEPVKNFLGFTKKPAKVGIFFQERLTKQGSQKDTSKTDKRPIKEQQKSKIDTRKPQERHQPQQSFKQQPTPKAPNTPENEQANSPKWTPEMVNGSVAWINSMVKAMGQESIATSTQVKQYYLTIRFEKPVLADKKKEQLLFKNWSFLLCQAMRQKFKRGLRGYKVIITSGS